MTENTKLALDRKKSEWERLGEAKNNRLEPLKNFDKMVYLLGLSTLKKTRKARR